MKMLMHLYIVSQAEARLEEIYLPTFFGVPQLPLPQIQIDPAPFPTCLV